ncbi:MAG: cytochrome c biogenesis protein CcsA [Paramuribaculum sp.]|nr:cytochrome c biogenesis protein CcsA [Paramuribaculum sp.]MDE7151032.1 cytochrome c biogenesis protein CcsA [Candidatus Amulumruptor sp.]
MPNFRFFLAVGVSLLIGATTLMSTTVYSSWWWIALWALIGCAIIWRIAAMRMWRRPVLFMWHISVLLVIAGGGITAFTADRGTISLVPGRPENVFVRSDGTTGRLPRPLVLQRFTTDFYPGMDFPRDFHSRVSAGDDTIDISMNRIGKLDGWRLYQTSYDGCGGSTLTVARDPIGIAVTYAGYLLFALAGAVLLLKRRDKVGRQGALALLLFLPVHAAASAPAIPVCEADSLEREPVMFLGRAMPFAEMASRLTFKLTGSGSVAGMTPTRFVASLERYADEWSREPIIAVKSAELRKRLAIEGECVALADLYDAEGNYRPESIYRNGSGRLDTEILRLDEKVALISRLLSGNLYGAAPPSARNSARFTAELWWARLSPLSPLFMITLAAAPAALMLTYAGRRRATSILAAAVSVAGAGVFVWRGIIEGYVPLADSGQIMLFTGVILAAASCMVGQRQPLIGALGLLMSGFTFLLSWISSKNPALTPLMPILASPWLMVHVMLVMMSYALLALTLPVALAALTGRTDTHRLMQLSLSLMLIGVYLLGTGIIAGAMWANVSWGRYWAWDPKETWALVTLLLYAIPLHRSTGLTRNPRMFHIYAALAFLSIVMTYEGVNHLSSLHAYR